MCVGTEHLYFEGAYLQEQNSYLHFELVKCEPLAGSDCATQSELEEYFQRHLITGVQSSSYIDFKDFEAPLKTRLDYVFVDQLSHKEQLARKAT